MAKGSLVGKLGKRKETGGHGGGFYIIMARGRFGQDARMKADGEYFPMTDVGIVFAQHERQLGELEGVGVSGTDDGPVVVAIVLAHEAGRHID